MKKEKMKQLVSDSINELLESDNYKKELTIICNLFIDLLIDGNYIISDLCIYPLDDEDIAFHFQSKDIDCYLLFFYLPEERAEYLANITKGDIMIYYKISTRKDFNEILELLHKNI